MSSNINGSSKSLICVEAAADDLDSIAGRIRAAIGHTIDAIIAIGQDLCRVEAKLPHGQFGSWIMHEFNFSERAAQNYMNAALAFADRTAIVAYLPATILYELAAKSTPSAVREDIVALLESDSTLAPDEIATRLRAARQRRETSGRKSERLPPSRDFRLKSGKARA